MRNLFFAAAAAVFLGAPAAASILVMGDTLAASCYKAAASRDPTPNALRTCDTAFSQGLIGHELMATHVNRGVLRLIRRNYDSADADFEAAMALDPTEPEAWLNKGILLMNVGRSREAIQPLDRAIELGTRRPAVAYYARGLAHEDSGNLRAAYSDLRRAQQLEPRWREVATELARYQVRTR